MENVAETESFPIENQNVDRLIYLSNLMSKVEFLLNMCPTTDLFLLFLRISQTDEWAVGDIWTTWQKAKEKGSIAY